MAPPEPTKPKTGSSSQEVALARVSGRRAEGDEELLATPEKNPFAIVCGTSAGAINAATLAVFADDFGTASTAPRSVGELPRSSRLSLRPHRIGRVGARWVAAITLLSRSSPEALLDNSPLAEMLTRNLEFGRIQENIDNGACTPCRSPARIFLRAERSFYQGGPDTTSWSAPSAWARRCQSASST